MWWPCDGHVTVIWWSSDGYLMVMWWSSLVMPRSNQQGVTSALQIRKTDRGAGVIEQAPGPKRAAPVRAPALTLLFGRPLGTTAGGPAAAAATVAKRAVPPAAAVPVRSEQNSPDEIFYGTNASLLTAAWPVLHAWWAEHGSPHGQKWIYGGVRGLPGWCVVWHQGPSQPSKVVLLQNMVGPGDVDDELEGETADECGKYGEVDRVCIFEAKNAPETQVIANAATLAIPCILCVRSRSSAPPSPSRALGSCRGGVPDGENIRGFQAPRIR
jgi:hypothetical protein